jgi:hypothetical protein
VRLSLTGHPLLGAMAAAGIDTGGTRRQRALAEPPNPHRTSQPAPELKSQSPESHQRDTLPQPAAPVAACHGLPWRRLVRSRPFGPNHALARQCARVRILQEHPGKEEKHMKREDSNPDILSLERKYWRAVVEHDVEAAKSLTDFPCLLAGPSGARIVDPEAFVRSMEDSAMPLEKAEIENAKVRMLSEDVAVIAYDVSVKMKQNGKSRTLHAADCSTWARRDGQWRCAMHAEAIRKSPSE